jgi:two-component system, OmpR family, phosphate regulon response regulator PhoB
MSASRVPIARMLNGDAGRILSRAQLLETVWGPTTIDQRIVDTHISQLRKALIQEGETNAIKTVRGFGYRLIESFDP